MQPGQIVVESDDARCAELEAAGWVVVSRSWAAQLTASGVDVDALSGAVSEAGATATSVSSETRISIRFSCSTRRHWPTIPAVSPVSTVR
ncbi:hypothetical protein [Microbacterium oleivorans]|uniref:hypothetical protein n=1 Tax=Microbacterium oleivorans TaxID=273677 RepID=UPI000B0D4B4A|nr:hypothetical protein [Microbacterium oleivorans]